NSRASALIDQPCLYRTCNSIQSAPDFTRGLLCGRWLGHHQLPTSEAPSPFPADRCPVQPRSLCTFRDQVIALFVIPYRPSSSACTERAKPGLTCGGRLAIGRGLCFSTDLSVEREAGHSREVVEAGDLG